MRASTTISYNGRTATVITESRAVAWLRKLSPHTGAFVLGDTIRLFRSVRAYLAGATSDYDRLRRLQSFAHLLAHEWAHVEQYQRDGWVFLPRWGWQVVSGTWVRLASKGRKLAWYLRPFEFLNQCAKLPQHARNAYKAAPLEVEAEVLALEHASAFESIVETLP